MATSPGNKEHADILTTVRNRIDRYVATSDSSVVLESAAVSEAVALVRIAGGPFSDPDTSYALAWLHWCRFLSLPDGKGHDDLAAAITLFTGVLRFWPDARVPAEVREDVGGGAALMAAALAEQGSTLLMTSRRIDDPAAFDAAVDRFRQAVAAAPEDHPVRLDALGRLASALGERGGRLRASADLDEAISIGQDVVRAMRPDDPALAGRLSNLGISLRVRCELDGERRDLAEAARCGRAAVDAAADHPNRPDYLTNLGKTLRVLARHGGGAEILAEAVRVGREAVAAVPENHPRRGSYLANLGAALLAGVETGDEDADLDATIVVLRAAVGALAGGLPAAEAYANLGAALRARYERTRSTADVHAMVDAQQQAVDAMPAVHPDRVGRVFHLGVAHQIRFDRTGDSSDLEAALAIAREVVAATSPSDPLRPTRQAALGIALRAAGVRAHDGAVLNEAVDHLRQAAETVQRSTDSVEIPMILQNLSTALHDRYLVTSVDADLREAVDFARRAVTAAAGDVHSGAALRVNLRAILLEWFEVSGDIVGLDEAVDAAREVVRFTHAEDPRRAFRVVDLCGELRNRYRATGEGVDLDEARVVAAETLEAYIPAEAEADVMRRGRALLLSELGITFELLYLRDGGRGLLDEAIRLGRAAAAAAGLNPHESGSVARGGSAEGAAVGEWWAMLLSRLGGSLRLRHNLTGDLLDLDEAAQVSGAAVVAATAEHHDHAVLLSNLGNIFLDRYLRGGGPADLDEAIRLGREALMASTAGRRDHDDRRSNLAVAILERSRRTGSASDLDEAVTLLREVVAAAATRDDSYLGGLQANLGLALHLRFDRSGDPFDLDEVIRVSHDAVEHTPGHLPDRAGFMVNLCRALQSRFDLIGDRADLVEILDTARTAAASETAPTRSRIVAALIWGQAAARDQQWACAADGFAVAVHLLTRLAPRSLAREDQERLLGELAGVGANAAVCCARAGQSERAVELFEQGHAILLGQTLDTRTDITALTEKHPDVASRFVALLEELDRAATDRGPRRREVATAFDVMVDEIRTRPGFETFLRAPTVEELRWAATDGPVIMITVSLFGCFALVLTAQGVCTPLELKATSFDEITELTLEFLTVVDDSIDGTADRAARRAAQRRLDEILEQVWTTVTEPVLDHIGFTSRPEEGQPWPRV